MDYDSEDIHSDPEDFSEDLLNDEEYDQLYNSLPILKAELESYNSTIPDIELKEILYNNYFEIDSSLAEVKESYPRKSVEHIGQIKREIAMSKLAALARSRRKLQESDDSGNKSVAILSRLTEDSTSSFSGTKKPIFTSKKVEVNKENLPKVIPSKSVKQPSPPIQEPPRDSTETEPQQKEVESPQFDTSLIRPSQYFHTTTKRRKLNLIELITNENLIETAKKNFGTPSPDEKVEQAQKQAFESGFSNLSVEERPQTSKSVTPKALTPKSSTPKSSTPRSSTPVPDIKSQIKSHKVFSKTHKSFVVIGHVDAGKSTLMGRILLDLGIVDIKTVNKLVKESESIGKGSFALAWVMDQTSEERARGVTIDIVATNFETTKTRFTAIDAPGHKDFVPQMINGVCQADFALLIVDSITGEFESGFSLDGQTKEHTLIAKNLGIDKLCVVVNKLDKENWSQQRYEFIKSTMKDYLIEEIGFKSDQIDFIPVSGLTGNNVVKNQKIPEFQWYKGPNLIEYCEELQLPNWNQDIDQISSESFNLVINDIFDVSAQEFQIIGKILSGHIQVNDQLQVLPINEMVKVQKLTVAKQPVKFALKGEIVEMTFSKKQLKEKTFDDILIGDILTNSVKVKSVGKFECKLSLFNLSKPLLVGTPFILFRNNFNIPAKLVKIISIETDSKRKKKHLISNQVASVEIEIDSSRLLPICNFKDDQSLGKVVIRKEGITIGAGVVISTLDVVQ